MCLTGLAVNAAIFGPDLRRTAHGTTDFIGFERRKLPIFSLFYWPFAQLKYPVASAVRESLCVLSLPPSRWLRHRGPPRSGNVRRLARVGQIGEPFRARYFGAFGFDE